MKNYICKMTESKTLMTTEMFFAATLIAWIGGKHQRRGDSKDHISYLWKIGSVSSQS